MHPRSKHWHLLDYVITRQKDRNDVLDTRVMRGADCATDHSMVRSKLALRIRPPRKKSKGKPPSKLNVRKLRYRECRQELQMQMDKNMDYGADDKSVEEEWELLKTTAYETANEILGKPKRKHQDWFDENDAELNALLVQRNKAKEQVLQRKTRASTARLTRARSQLQKYTRSMKSKWWEEKAKDLQRAADANMEQNMELYVVFIDFMKAFDAVSREGLWCVLKKFGCTDKVLNLLKAFHDGMQAKVVQGKNISSEFAVTNGVKQGCVLAPTLFSLYLTAMLHVAFKDDHNGIHILTRHDADLFNVSHFKAKTRTSKHLVREMLFADDSALVAHTAQDMQTLVDRFSRAATQFSLKINIKKTECLYQPIKLLSSPPKPKDITINNIPLVQTTDFTYLSSTISSSSEIDKELSTRIGKASASFGKLRDRLWNNRHVSIKVKCQVYRAVVLSTLLYGAETWTIYRAQVKKLHAFMMRQLKDIMGIVWQDKITNVEILRRANLPSMADILTEKNLRWLGHVQRMETERLPRQLLYSQLRDGKRNQGRPRLRYKDVVKRNMKWRQIPANSWQNIAGNRASWRSAIKPNP